MKSMWEIFRLIKYLHCSEFGLVYILHSAPKKITSSFKGKDQIVRKFSCLLPRKICSMRISIVDLVELAAVAISYSDD